MSRKFLNDNNDRPGPPPGAGHTFSDIKGIRVIRCFYAPLAAETEAPNRRVAAERDANLTPPDGNGAGMSSRGVLTGPAVLLICAVLTILAARLLWHAPRCTGPTQADRCPLAGGFNTSEDILK
jgi:hypothetical protein